MFNNVIETYQDILLAVRQHIPEAVLVGGCLRDTFYGVEVKDLDFVVPLAQHNRALYPLTPQSAWLQEIWPNKTFEYCVLGDERHGVQEEMEGVEGEHPLQDVIKSTDDTVNFIIVTDIPAYTNQFPDSISKLVFDGETIHYANEWMVGHNTTTVFYRPDIIQARLEKLQRKYPDWVFQRDRVEEEQQELAIEW